MPYQIVTDTLMKPLGLRFTSVAGEQVLYHLLTAWVKGTPNLQSGRNQNARVPRTLERWCFEGRYPLPFPNWRSSQSPTSQKIEPPGLRHTSIVGEQVSYRLPNV